MQKYKNGLVAAVGDFVKGRPDGYNHDVVGALVSITDGMVQLNCVVMFAEEVVLAGGELSADLSIQENSLLVQLRRPIGGLIEPGQPLTEGQMETIMAVPKLAVGTITDFQKV